MQIEMNPTLKKILLYFSIAGALIVAVLGIVSIWGGINEDVIGRTILTYLILFLSILSISWVHKVYDRFLVYPELASMGNWLLTISISVVALLICISIWDFSLINFDLLWKIIATIGIVNFAAIIFIFSMNKWGPKSPD